MNQPITPPAPSHPPSQASSAKHAYTANGQTVSSADFYAIACNPARAVVVEACAGAGKTWMLVSRILRALLAGAEPQHILAITFTKKAAAEMRARLQEWLAEFATAPAEKLIKELQNRGMSASEAAQHAPALQGLYLKLLRHGRTVQIRTFHSWFAALLRAAPLQILQQLQLPPDYELLEDNSRAVQAVWQPFHAALLREPSLLADYQSLLDEHGRSNAQKALTAALERRTEFMLADAHGIPQASVPHFSQAFENYPHLQGADDPITATMQNAAVRDLLQQAARALGQATGKTANNAATALEQALGANSWQDICTALLTQKNEPRKLNGKSDNLPIVIQAQDVLEDTLQAQTQHQGWQHQQRMVRLTRKLCQIYAQVKHSQGWIDMNDVESAARVLLQDSHLGAWVQERLDASVRHLLIDEFQDTNPLQWQTLHAWLQSYAGAGQAPSVFIVGDPKQSIYRFRRADPEVFRAARSFVQEALKGDTLSCDHTRRNAQAIITAVNANMLTAHANGLMGEYRAHTTQAEHSGYVLALPQIPRPDKKTKAAANANADGEASADDTQTDTPAWRDSLSTPKLEAEERLITLECQQAARWLGSLIQAGLPAGEIIVMARKNEHLAVMKQALAACAIPAQLAEKNLLADAPEIQDIIALVDALISPRHNLSLAHALRSPLFGLSDAQLIDIALGVQQAAQQLAEQDQKQTEAQTQEQAAQNANTNTATPPSWLAWLLSHAPSPQPSAEQSAEPDTEPDNTEREPDSERPWAALASRLQRWQNWLQHLSPHDALDAIYREGDLLARYAAATPAAQRVAVLERLQALPAQTLALDGGRYASAYQWVRAMRNGSSQTTPDTVSPNTVRLLTVHGAKGLEAELVLLIDTDCQKKKAESMTLRIDWPGAQPHPQKLVFLASESNPPPSAEILLQQEQAADQRETYNAWYVAMTRARSVLAVSSSAPHQNDAQSWWKQMQATAQAQPLALGDEQPDEQPEEQTDEQSANLPASLHHWAQIVGQEHRKKQQKTQPNQTQHSDTNGTPEGATNSTSASTPAVGAAASPAIAATASEPITLPALAPLPAHLRRPAPAAPAPAELQLLARIGQAMHQILEWHSAQAASKPASEAASEAASATLAHLQQVHQLTPEQAQQAWQSAQAILQGEGGWAWSAAELLWQGNEIDIAWQGKILRLDRLVQRRPTASTPAAWWVLDYKSAPQPQQQAALIAQLQTYREAIKALHPQSSVNAAFLTADGKQVLVD